MRRVIYGCGCWMSGDLVSPYCQQHGAFIIKEVGESEMLNPKEQHESEQAVAHLSEFTPHLLWNYYKRLQEEGFSESQSFELCKIYMFGFGGGKYTT